MKKIPLQKCLNCTQTVKEHGRQFCSRRCCADYGLTNNIRFGGPPNAADKICHGCGVAFYKARNRLVYCSEECKIKSYLDRGLKTPAPSKPLPVRDCLHCKKTFKAKSQTNVYCSSKCMGLHRRDTGQLQDFIKMAKENTGPRDLSKETREKMSLSASNRNAQREYTRGIGGVREDIGHYVRSTWEANFARYIKYLGYSYEYEEEQFSLEIDGNIKTYRPDFKFGGKFYEIKGWWTEKSIKIKNAFSIQYPNIKIIYISEKEYGEIERKYAKQIQNWEYKKRR